MIINNERIKEDSINVYKAMNRMVHYSFNELQRLCHLESTDLCLALIQLLRESKIEQNRDKTGIYYTPC